jgi:hypothetical protein
MGPTLVFKSEDGIRDITTSLIITEIFSKRPADLLRDIENLFAVMSFVNAILRLCATLQKPDFLTTFSRNQLTILSRSYMLVVKYGIKPSKLWVARSSRAGITADNQEIRIQF